MKNATARCLILFSLLSLGSSAASAAPPIASAEWSGYSFVLKFDTPMLTWLGTADLSNVVIAPPVACHWSWADNTQLACERTGLDPLALATRYQISVRGGFWSQQGEENATQILTADTDRPQLSAEIREWRQGVPLIEIESNVAISAEQLRAHLDLVIGNSASLDYALQEIPALKSDRRTNPPQRWKLQMQASEGVERIVAIRVKPGLLANIGSLAGEQDTTLLQVRLNEPFHLRLVGCSNDYSLPHSVQPDDDGRISFNCAAGAEISLEFSSAPNAESLALLRANLPRNIEFRRAEATPPYLLEQSKDVALRPGYFLRLVASRADETRTIELPENFIAEDGEKLDRRVPVTVHVGDFASTINSSPSRMVVPLDAEMPQIIVTRNAGELSVEQHALGAALDTREKVLPAGRKNVLARKAPPDPSRDVRRDGGLIDGVLRNHDQGQARNLAGYSVAYASFNITASAAGHQLLIWTTEWDGARSIAGAKVEVLHARDKTTTDVLASGITAADGTVVIDLPAELPKKATVADLLIRASRSDQRVVIPLSGALPVADSAERRGDRYSALAEGDSVSWGVTDRPLYRPGDAVNYRLWARQRQANHLVARTQQGDLHLALIARYGGNVVGKITVPVDAFGSVAGSWSLPRQIHDDDYCITEEGQTRSDSGGACFRVTAHHANDLWVELHSSKDVAMDGDTIILETSSGFYSGGPAANVGVTFGSLLTPLSLEQAYPEFREFSFIDVFGNTFGNEGEQFSEALPQRVTTDANGIVRVDAKLTNPSLVQRQEPENRKPIPFGTLELTAEAALSASNYATSAPASVRFSRYTRFVGLKVSPWLLSADSDAQIEAVVIGFDGKAIAGAPVQLSIEEVTTPEDNTPVKQLAHCEWHIGETVPCKFRPTKSARYRFRASSGNAAIAIVERYAALDPRWVDNDKPGRAKVVASASDVAIGGTAQLLIEQPFAKAQALITVTHGRVLKHWVQTLDQDVSKLAVPIPAEWSPGVTIAVAILDADGPAFGPHASPGGLIELGSADIRITGADPARQLALALDHDNAHPGEEIAITLHNSTDHALQVTLDVVDDAVRALVPELAQATDPASAQWLGKLNSWGVVDWYGFGGWARRVVDEKKEIFAPSVFQFGLFDANASDRPKLETIEVTGSRITAADIFQRGGKSDHSLGAPMSATGASGHARLRSRFIESAAWQSDIELAAGSSRTVRVHLPDNLTRWRVMAWSADSADGFALAQTTIATSLPIELRSDVPARLYPGDDARLSVSVRNHAAISQLVNTQFDINGAGITAAQSWQGAVAANAQHTATLAAHPLAAGQLDIDARASAANGADGISAAVEVASPSVRGKVSVAGWLSSDAVSLKMPALPAGATQPRLHVDVARGALALAKGWTNYLHDYPHRCWEQMLSRAVGVAAARKLGLSSSPQADDAIAEVLASAHEFQAWNSEFYFFAGMTNANGADPSLYLTAYSAKVFALLHQLGYRIPEELAMRTDHSLRETLQRKDVIINSSNQDDFAAAINAVGADAIIVDNILNPLWERRHDLSWFARAELARGLSRRPVFADRTALALEELRGAGTLVGDRRVLDDAHAPDRHLGSRLRDQCAVIGALAQLDRHADALELRNAFLRGLSDLYAGGAATDDTQSDGQCLMMLVRWLPPKTMAEPLQVSLRGGTIEANIDLAANQISRDFSVPLGVLPPSLDLQTTSTSPALLSFVASIDYDEDGRQAQSAAIGYSLERSYAVLRDHAWKDAPAATIHEGDWVRTTLRISNRATRYFVAVSDNVPGGLRPTDLELAGISDIELRSLASWSSPYFYSHQVDERHARFYAELLPPGVHEIHYYSRAAYAGNYAALPATAELMYGGASAARTASSRLIIAAPGATATTIH